MWGTGIQSSPGLRIWFFSTLPCFRTQSTMAFYNFPLSWHNLVFSLPAFKEHRVKNTCMKWRILITLLVQIRWDRKNRWLLPVYIYTRGLLSHRKGRSDVSCRFYMVKSQKHFTKWKKPDPKSHIVYDSICMKCLKQKAGWWMPIWRQKEMWNDWLMVMESERVNGFIILLIY